MQGADVSSKKDEMMEGYWRASYNGVEVARGREPDEALDIAVQAGYDQNFVVVEFMYETPRAGSGIHRI